MSLRKSNRQWNSEIFWNLHSLGLRTKLTDVWFLNLRKQKQFIIPLIYSHILHQFTFLKLISEKLGIGFIPILQRRDRNILISTIMQTKNEHGKIDFVCQS